MGIFSVILPAVLVVLAAALFRARREADSLPHRVAGGLGLVLALTGTATLWMAVFADMGASLLVVFNGLRLLKTRGA